MGSSFVGEHDFPDMIGQAAFGFPGSLSFGEFPLVVGVPGRVGQISHEHTTSGTVKLVRLTDGSHVVRLESLDTSNGPDLRVWLTDAPVKPG
ncbi:DM13 domain-containing protein, partial [Streptomyces phaeochromogenes]